MKKLIVFVLVLVLAALILPVSNLVVKPKVNTALTSHKGGDAAFSKVAGILEAKCVVCHAPNGGLPFYASFPIAKPLIEKDVADGISFLDMTEALLPPDGQPVSQPVLAKIEHTLEHGTMPPGRFLAMHWDGSLTAAEKETVLGWIKGIRKANYSVAGVAAEFENEPVQPLPLEHGQNPEIVALGNKVFHDKRLSKDNTLACASCHGLDKGGTDQARFSTGINGQVGGINSPTVFNSGLFFKQFWDGRAATLEEQANGPVNNPIEMGSNWEEALPKLQQDPELVAAFTKLFPDGLTSANAMSSIAIFERSLLTPSRFDKYLRGDKSALSDEEKQGYEVFKEHACATCHVGSAMGGQSFEKMGLRKDYFADRGDVKEPDNGRFSATKKESDKHKFKVPTLRNLKVTFPFFHDSTTEDLKQAVKTMAKYQSPKGELTDQQADLVVKFLLSLSGEYDGKPL